MSYIFSLILFSYLSDGWDHSTCQMAGIIPSARWLGTPPVGWLELPHLLDGWDHPNSDWNHPTYWMAGITPSAGWLGSPHLLDGWDHPTCWMAGFSPTCRMAGITEGQLFWLGVTGLDYKLPRFLL